MKLKSYQPGVSLSPRLHSQKGFSRPEWNVAKPEQPSLTWVKLQEPPSLYSHDEALLLCQSSESEWLAWVPDYGEVVLSRHQFTEMT
jgi:hypothetical protein